MVFGNCYCAISHLEIKDGDKCVLIPLGFRMNYEFNKWNKADINSFMYLYVFIHEPQPVIFQGNYSDIKYLKKEYKNTEHEMYMLVHDKFYNTLIKEYKPHGINRISSLALFNTVVPIWEKVHEHEDHERTILEGKLNDKKITQDQFVEMVMNMTPPEWVQNIYKVAMFMGQMGIMPSPNISSDQHQINELYEKFRETAKK